MFAVKRGRAAAQTGETFERPVDFHIERYLKCSFRAWRGEGSYQVKLRFGPEVAGRVAEKSWHRSQTTEPCADGGLLVTGRYRGRGRQSGVALDAGFAHLIRVDEVKHWVLSWGRECRVVGPEELKHLVKGELTAMRDQLISDETRQPGRTNAQ